MTSTPAYDPNEFTTGIDPVVWAQLASDPETPLMNRVIQGTYAPGQHVQDRAWPRPPSRRG